MPEWWSRTYPSYEVNCAWSWSLSLSYPHRLLLCYFDRENDEDLKKTGVEARKLYWWKLRSFGVFRGGLSILRIFITDIKGRRRRRARGRWREVDEPKLPRRSGKRFLEEETSAVTSYFGNIELKKNWISVEVLKLIPEFFPRATFLALLGYGKTDEKCGWRMNILNCCYIF